MTKILYFNLRRYPQKNFLCTSRLWVGRRKETILSYVTKNNEKKNLGKNGLKKSPTPLQIWPIRNHIFLFYRTFPRLHLPAHKYSAPAVHLNRPFKCKEWNRRWIVANLAVVPSQRFSFIFSHKRLCQKLDGTRKKWIYTLLL